MTLARCLDPWGEVLVQSGDGELTWGYFGGQMDAATGLIYAGNGQYYDPSTGRFLTRQPGRINPYVPWGNDPLGLLVGPLALLVMLRWPRRRRRKASKIETILTLLLMALAFGAVLAACGGGTETPPSTQPPTVPPSGTPLPAGPSPSPSQPGGTPQPPTWTPKPSQTCTATNTSNPTATLIGQFNMSAYYIPIEDEARFQGSGTVPIPSSYTKWKIGKYLSSIGSNYYWNEEDGAERAKLDFLYNHDSVCMQGTGKLTNGRYISCAVQVDWVGIASDARRNQKDPPESFIGFEWATEKDLTAFYTVARCGNSAEIDNGDELIIPELQSYLTQHGGSGILRVTDTGGALCSTPETLDLFVGEGQDGFNAYLELMQRTGDDIPALVMVYKK